MKKIFITYIVLLFTIGSQAFAQQADAIKGKWFTEDKDAQIEIYKERNKYYGKIIWLQEPTEGGKPIVDNINVDPSKRNRPLMGLRILNDFEFVNDSWRNGTIYDPNNGKIYSCTIEKKDANTLEIHGFVGISLIGRSVEWTRVEAHK